MSYSKALFFFLFSLVFTLGAAEPKITVGQPFPQISVKDQFDQDLLITPKTRNVMMVFDMELSKTVKAWLSEKPKNYLEDHHAVYLADISSMPRIITFLFANRKMRKYPFRMGLIKDDKFSKDYPVETENVLVLTQSLDGKIMAIHQAKNMTELETILSNH